MLLHCFDINTKEIKTTLPKEVLVHINKTSNKDFKKVSKLGWSFLIDTLIRSFKIDFKKDKVLFSKNGKPYLKSNQIYFSLSHSLNIIAIAISDKPIGVDVENIIPDNLCDLLSKRILNETQYNNYESEKDKSIYLTKIWTQKEAYIKCIDESILNVDALKSITTNENNTSLIKDSKGNKYFLSYYEK